MAERLPEEWLVRLEKKLEERRPTIQKTEDYYGGRHRLAFATSKFREAFGALFSAFADNWCQIVVDASVERLSVEGFRFGEDAAADEQAWAFWQTNNMDSASVMAHTEAVKHGCAYLLVDPTRGGIPRITVETPHQVYVEHDTGDRRVRLAAIKKWKGDDDHLYATVYLPNGVWKYRTDKPQRTAGSRLKWEPRPDDEFTENPLGVVPIVPLENNPSLMWGGSSDLTVAIPLNDAVNKLVSDMIVNSEYQAFKQRVLTGVEIPRDPETGEVLADVEIKAAMSRLWTFEDPNAKVTELGGTDPGNYVKAIELMVQHLAAQTRTPPHYLLSDMTNLSADALKAAETGLKYKVERKQRDFGDAWEEVMRLCFMATGDDTHSVMVAETQWKPAQTRNDAQMADALIKLRQVGVPFEQLWHEWGYSPQDIERMKALANLPDRVPTTGATNDTAPALATPVDSLAPGADPTLST